MTETTKQNMSILAITILIAASVYIFINFIKPEIQTRKELVAQILEEQDKIKILNDYQNKFNILTQNYQNLGNKIDMINQAIPTDSQTAQVLATLDAISKKTNLSLTSLNFSTQTGSNNSYDTLDIKTDFSTDYNTFKNWLSEIEKELRLFDINHITIKSVIIPITTPARRTARTNQSVLQFSLDLLTYYQL
ncbi:MAG: type 4a pilus biogenesis protein PilO [Minisyncoccia bacterium]